MGNWRFQSQKRNKLPRIKEMWEKAKEMMRKRR